MCVVIRNVDYIKHNIFSKTFKGSCTLKFVENILEKIIEDDA
jgi:hypothetical protein